MYVWTNTSTLLSDLKYTYIHTYTYTQRDIDRYRLLGVPIKIVDHEEEEERKLREKAEGKVRYIETEQGFNLTEDQFNMKEEWDAPEEEVKLWDSIRECAC
jgi:hypothetical protein